MDKSQLIDRTDRFRSQQPPQPPLRNPLNEEKGDAAVADKSNVRSTVIGPELTIEGKIQSDGQVRLEGLLLGDIECNSFTLGKEGEMKGKIAAEEVFLHGQLTGKISGGQVLMFADAIVKGDITHKGISIEMGARYDGRLKAFVERKTKAKTKQKAEG